MSQSRFASRMFSRHSITLCAVLAFVLPGQAQSAPADKSAAPAPDVLVFTNGDQLTGKLLREVSGSVTFHSDMAGDVTVTWDKIKSIHSSQQFAVIQPGQHVNRKTPEAAIAHGPIQVQDSEVKVGPPEGGATKDIPVKNAQYMIDQDTYNKEVKRNPGWGYGWSGSVTAGATLVEATQNSRNFTGGAAIARTHDQLARPTRPYDF
jgi:hypothetical protein